MIRRKVANMGNGKLVSPSAMLNNVEVFLLLPVVIFIFILLFSYSIELTLGWKGNFPRHFLTSQLLLGTHTTCSESQQPQHVPDEVLSILSFEKPSTVIRD